MRPMSCFPFLTASAAERGAQHVTLLCPSPPIVCSMGSTTMTQPLGNFQVLSPYTLYFSASTRSSVRHTAPMVVTVQYKNHMPCVPSSSCTDAVHRADALIVHCDGPVSGCL
ncbi:hypothetical protein GDO81_007891 [Engystomops pustulosus]|uniref:Secreted protein n=1 Tax=Engystomops pustulosus TaxID=76066 RepID=A0AAV7CBF4_ENGPU|nr:hypothetical protein GDO81_007891 [Engystomops pustulosus]